MARAPDFRFIGIVGIRGPLRRLGRRLARVGVFLYGVLDLAHGVLHLAFDLLGRTLDLLLGIARPLSYLALDASPYILQLSFNPIFIHVVLLDCVSCKAPPCHVSLCEKRGPLGKTPCRTVQFAARLGKWSPGTTRRTSQAFRRSCRAFVDPVRDSPCRCPCQCPWKCGPIRTGLRSASAASAHTVCAPAVRDPS